MKPDQPDIGEVIREKSGLDIATTRSTQRLTLRLSLESKRKVHALAMASNRSIEQVIEELIEGCSDDDA